MALTKVSRGLLSTGIVDNSTTTAITIDSSENVGIGTSSPNSYASQTTLTINGSTYGRLDIESAGTLRASLFSTTGSTTLSAATDVLSFDTSGGEAMRIDSSGNVGIGVTPSTWPSSGDFRALQIGSGLSLYGRGSGDADRVGMTANAYVDVTNDRFEYIATGNATHYTQSDGSHIWSTAPSGSANGAISFSESMRIDSSGNVLVGTTSSSGDTANDRPVVAGNFTTKYGVTSIASVNTWTTVHTFGANQGNFMVSMRASGTGNIAHNSVSIVAINDTATTSAILLSGSAVQIRIVGLTLQVLQNVFAGANINWSIMSIGN